MHSLPVHSPSRSPRVNAQIPSTSPVCSPRHDSQCAPQRSLQQTPSLQKPVVHSVSFAQPSPSIGVHIPSALQRSPFWQSPGEPTRATHVPYKPNWLQLTHSPTHA